MNKNEKFNESMNQIDDKFIVEAENAEFVKQQSQTEKAKSAKKPANKKAIFSYASIAAVFCICIALAFAFIPKMNLNKDSDRPADSVEEAKGLARLPAVEVDREELTDQDSAPIDRWEDMTITQKFGKLEIGENKFNVNGLAIDSTKLGEKIGNYVMSGYDFYTQNTYTTNVEAFAIKGINTKSGVAIKYAENENYYPACNSYYQPTTLGEFKNDLSISENLEIGKVNYRTDFNGVYSRFVFTNLSKEKVLAMLFDDDNTQMIYPSFQENTAMGSEAISFGIDFKILGYKNISIAITEKGYVSTNLLNTGKYWLIGEEKTQEFIDYVINELDGYRVVYKGMSSNSSTNPPSSQSSVASPTKTEKSKYCPPSETKIYYSTSQSAKTSENCFSSDSVTTNPTSWAEISYRSTVRYDSNGIPTELIDYE